MNLITLPRWQNYCEELCKNDENYVIENILIFNEDHCGVFDFNKYKNKTLILINGDIDFPPVKTPHLNDNELHMSYDNRINYKAVSIIENFNIQIICYSSSIYHQNVRVIPLGVSWQMPLLNIQCSKKILCYANYGMPTVQCWHGNIRKQLTHIISNIPYIYKDNISLDTHKRKSVDKYQIYYQCLAHSKFAICPRGCGIDTYRMYDALFYNCIPIILKTNNFYKNLYEFPLLALNTWEDLLNYDEKTLNEIYEEKMAEYKSYKEYLNIDYYKVK